MNRSLASIWSVLCLGLMLTLFPGMLAADQFVDKIGFEVIIEKNRDIVVTETIVLKSQPSVRNFVRVLPKRFGTKGGLVGVAYDINFLYINGKSAPFTRRDADDHVATTFGEPGKVLSGDLSFMFQYRIRGALKTEGDLVSLRFPVPGKWGVTVGNVEVAFRLPPFMLASSVKRAVSLLDYAARKESGVQQVRWATLASDNDREALALGWNARLKDNSSLIVSLEMPAGFFREP